VLEGPVARSESLPCSPAGQDRYRPVWHHTTSTAVAQSPGGDTIVPAHPQTRAPSGPSQPRFGLWTAVPNRPTILSGNRRCA